MTPFTSGLERRLWTWALAVLIAIYSTIGLAGTLAPLLSAEGLLAVAFAACFLCAIAAVIGIALRRRPGMLEVWVTVAAIAVGAMVVVRMGVGPAERTHLFEYGLLAVLVHEALSERRRNGRRVPLPGLLAVVITAVMGWGDEAIQAVVPDRVYDPRDVGINALAAVAATSAKTVLAWMRGRNIFRARQDDRQRALGEVPEDTRSR